MDPEPHDLLIAISGQSTKSCTCLLSKPHGSNGARVDGLSSFPASRAVQVLNGNQLLPRKMAMGPLSVKKAPIKTEARSTQTTKSQSSRVVGMGPPIQVRVSRSPPDRELASAMLSPLHPCLPVADFGAVRSRDRPNAFPRPHTRLTLQV